MALSDALAALDATRTSLVAEFDAFGPEQRTFSPAPESWSPEQVAEHLLAVDRGILGAIQASAGKTLGMPSREAVEGVIAFMASDQIAQTPPFLQPQGASYAESRQGLETVGLDWHALAESHADTPADRAVCTHPMAGPMTLLDTLRFVEAHAGHHRHQLERIRASEGFPV